MFRVALLILLITYADFEQSTAAPLNVTLDEDVVPLPHHSRSRSIEDRAVLWQKVVPYVFDPSLPYDIQILFKRAVLQFKKHLPCLRFVERKPEHINYVSVRPYHGCVSSGVGMMGGEQAILLDTGCGLTGAMHEMMHVIGFIHEHTRDDRDHYIKVHMQNFRDEGVRYQVGYLQRIKEEYRKYLPYDYLSLMHYSPYVMNKAGQKIFSVKNVDSQLEWNIGRVEGFSSCDVYKMNFIYGCKNYTDYQREAMCRLNNKRAKIV